MNLNHSENLNSNKIKIFIARKGISKYGKNVGKIIKDNIFSNKDFDAYIDLISNQHTIDDFKNYLKFLRLYLKVNNFDTSKFKINNSFIRILLCAYTIIFFPEIMNIDDKNDVSRMLIEKSKSITLNLKIIQMIKVESKFSFTTLKNINSFFEKCMSYVKLFNEWKDLDMEAVICNLAKVYMDLDRDFKEIEQNTKREDESSVELLRITKQNVENEKDKIIRKVKKLSKNGIEIFNKYHIFLNQQMDLNIYEQKLSEAISENVQKAYWDIIKSDMLKVPPDYDKVILLLEEAKLILKQCVPNRPDLISEIDIHLEVETLRHYLDNDIDVTDFITNMIGFITNKIKEFQARTEEESFNKFLEDFEKLRSQETCRLSEMLLFFFQGVMPRLDFILQSKRNFENWYTKNINK